MSANAFTSSHQAFINCTNRQNTGAQLKRSCLMKCMRTQSCSADELLVVERIHLRAARVNEHARQLQRLHQVPGLGVCGPSRVSFRCRYFSSISQSVVERASCVVLHAREPFDLIFRELAIRRGVGALD